MQHDEILRFEDLHRIFNPQGASAALVEARRASKIRYIGFTGHTDPRTHLTGVRGSGTLSANEGPAIHALLTRTAAAAATGGNEPFKTSSIFDGTADHPEWLGAEPERLQRPVPARCAPKRDTGLTNQSD